MSLMLSLWRAIDVVVVNCRDLYHCDLARGKWPLYTLTRGGSQLDSFHAAQIASRKHSDTPLLNPSEATYTTHKDPTQNST